MSSSYPLALILRHSSLLSMLPYTRFKCGQIVLISSAIFSLYCFVYFHSMIASRFDIRSSNALLGIALFDCQLLLAPLKLHIVYRVQFCQVSPKPPLGRWHSYFHPPRLRLTLAKAFGCSRIVFPTELSHVRRMLHFVTLRNIFVCGY